MLTRRSCRTAWFGGKKFAHSVVQHVCSTLIWSIAPAIMCIFIICEAQIMLHCYTHFIEYCVYIYTTVDIKTEQDPLLLGLIYRPPSNSVDLAGIESVHTVHPSKLKNAVPLGDLIVHLMTNSQTINWLVLYVFIIPHHLTQVVEEPTRVSDHSSSLINHVYVSDTFYLQSCSTKLPQGSSDHSSTLIIIKRSVLSAKRTHCTV